MIRRIRIYMLKRARERNEARWLILECMVREAEKRAIRINERLMALING